MCSAPGVLLGYGANLLGFGHFAVLKQKMTIWNVFHSHLVMCIFPDRHYNNAH